MRGGLAPHQCARKRNAARGRQKRRQRCRRRVAHTRRARARTGPLHRWQPRCPSRRHRRRPIGKRRLERPVGTQSDGSGTAIVRPRCRRCITPMRETIAESRDQRRERRRRNDPFVHRTSVRDAGHPRIGQSARRRAYRLYRRGSRLASGRDAPRRSRRSYRARPPRRGMRRSGAPRRRT